MRGRNGRGPNPLTRSFESNGPDVKVRHRGPYREKYMQLARDAQSSGDRIQAESYLEHAEHITASQRRRGAESSEPQQSYRQPDG